jgi:hypothetical protein
MYVGVQERLLFLSDCNQFWNGNCALLGCYAASRGNSLPTFRDHLSVPSCKGQRSSHLPHGASLKPHRIGMFRKITISVSDVDFHANLSSCFVRTYGRTDRNDGVGGRFSQLLCERAYKLFPISQRRCFSITKVSHLMLVRQVFFFYYYYSGNS